MVIEEPPEILLVEDSPYDAELALHVFKKNHLANNVRWLRDGAEALDYLFHRGAFAELDPRTMRPKVVLLDIKLPLVDGLEVLRQLKADTDTRQIPVVLLTSSREERDIMQGYANGANGYMVKPVDFDQFSEAMRAFGAYWLLVNRPPELN
jgi:two-component system response regulator